MRIRTIRPGVGLVQFEAGDLTEERFSREALIKRGWRADLVDLVTARLQLQPHAVRADNPIEGGRGASIPPLVHTSDDPILRAAGGGTQVPSRVSSDDD